MKRSYITRKKPNQRKVAINKAFKAERRLLRAQKGVWPVEDPKYLEWLRSQPCVVCEALVHCVDCDADVTARAMRETGKCPACGDDMPMGVRVVQAGRSDPAHVGLRGSGQTCSDREAIPLCRAHHRRGEPGGHHDLGKRFWTVYGLDRYAVILECNERYERYEREAA